MIWGERVGGGKTAKTTTEEVEMPCGQRSGGNGGRGGRLQSLQGRCRVFVSMDAPPHATKFQDLPRQMTMADPPLHGQEVSGEGKTMQNLYCSYLRQMGMHMPPWGVRCIRV